jgi:hypothetical protein
VVKNPILLDYSHSTSQGLLSLILKILDGRYLFHNGQQVLKIVANAGAMKGFVDLLTAQFFIGPIHP